jgi:glycosyltransferase involved in cell wall biosynthesis
VSLLAARAARAARRPFVLVQHSPWVAYGPLLDAVERTADAVLGRRVIAAADRVVCVSDHTADYVRSLVPDARIVVLPNGVDTGRFRPAAGTSASRPVVLVVRRLVRRTGVDRLLTAWRLAGLDERAELHVVGDGPERAALEAAASDLTHVRFLGRVDDDALVAHYQQAHVSVVPTSSGEGFGLSAAESLACGTPVVAVDEGALREVVTDGVDGLLVAQADVAALGAALRRIVDDPALRARLAEGTGHRDWSGEQQAAALTGLLGELCGTGRTLHPGRTGARGAAAATGGAR